MTDKLIEALEWFNYHGPSKITHLSILVEAARRWASFPTDEDAEAMVRELGRCINLRDPQARPILIFLSDARAALEAVKREDR